MSYLRLLANMCANLAGEAGSESQHGEPTGRAGEAQHKSVKQWLTSNDCRWPGSGITRVRILMLCGLAGGTRCFLASHAIPSQHHPTCEAEEDVALAARPGPRCCPWCRGPISTVLRRSGSVIHAAVPIAWGCAPWGHIR